MTQDVYITAIGKCLPGPPVSNDEMEEYLGQINGRPSRLRKGILQQNHIVSRHYAMDRNQKSLFRNSEMAADAVRDALSRADVTLSDVEMLAAATTFGDLLAPGFASMVQGELAARRCEIASLHGICASGMMALKSVFSQIRSEEKHTGVACASEFASRRLKASLFENQESVRAGKPLPFSAEFLRWMLSDGAGAAVLQDRPNRHRQSLRVDWIEIHSYAHSREVCMSVGMPESTAKSWQDYDSVQDAATDGAFNLNQDVRMLDDVVQVCVDGFLELVEQGRLDPANIDWMLCHYSSHFFRKRIFEVLTKAGVAIPEERWFTNLYSKGNVGSASPYLLLEELFNERDLQPGQKILCVVPESGRFVACYMLLTVVGPEQEGDVIEIVSADTQAPQLRTSSDPIVESTTRRLVRTWIDFEDSLHAVPVVQRIERGTLSIEMYRQILLQIRQQVVEGSRWIARAASNVSADHFPLRSAFLQHAVAEHRDFLLLESDFLACGGSIEEIQTGEKNVGSEALSAWVFQQASQTNPFDLLGAMFIIEGLGVRVAGKWAKAIRRQLRLGEDSVSFLAHHALADEDHFERLESCLASGIVDEKLADRIVKTARVTARLYRLQLEEIAC